MVDVFIVLLVAGELAVTSYLLVRHFKKGVDKLSGANSDMTNLLLEGSRQGRTELDLISHKLEDINKKLSPVVAEVKPKAVE